MVAASLRASIHLAPPEIFFRASNERESCLDLLVGEAVAGLDLYLSFLCRCAVTGRGTCRMPLASIRNLTSNARHSRSHGGNAFQIETGQGAAILCQFALTLQNVNGDVGLSVDLRGVKCVADAGMVEFRRMIFVGDSAATSMPAIAAVTSSKKHILGGFRSSPPRSWLARPRHSANHSMGLIGVAARGEIALSPRREL